MTSIILILISIFLVKFLFSTNTSSSSEGVGGYHYGKQVDVGEEKKRLIGTSLTAKILEIRPDWRMTLGNIIQDLKKCKNCAKATSSATSVFFSNPSPSCHIRYVLITCTCFSPFINDIKPKNKIKE